MTQVIERMFETIGLHSPTPDLGDTIERSWTMLLYAGFFGPITEEFFFRGAGLRGLERYGKIFAIVMTAILFGLFMPILTSSFRKYHWSRIWLHCL